jgi:membrane fusion protein, multidrug efflux system
MEPTTLDQETTQEKEIDSRPAKKPDPESQTVPGRKPLGRKLAIFLVIFVIAAAGLILWLRSLNHVSTDDAQVDGHIAPVSAKISGNVVEVLVDDNQAVKKGQVLVRIDPRDYQVRVDQAQAAVVVAMSQAHGASVGVPLVRETTQSGTSSAEAQLIGVQADYEKARVDYERSSNADISYARANVAAAQASYDRAQADLNRMKPLVDKAEISRQQFDSYVAAERVGESQLQAAKDKLTSAIQDAETKKAMMQAAQAHITQARAGVKEAKANQQQVNVRAADAQSATANVGVARSNLAAAQLNLSYTTITAPMDGVVTKKGVEVGQIVQPGQSLLMIVPLNDIWLTANFKETQLRDVHPGQKAEVKVDLTGKTYPGHVDSISGATGTRMSLLPPENATGNYVKVVQRIPVKVVLEPIPGGNNILGPGMNASVTIFTK